MKFVSLNDKQSKASYFFCSNNRSSMHETEVRNQIFHRYHYSGNLRTALRRNWSWNKRQVEQSLKMDKK